MEYLFDVIVILTLLELILQNNKRDSCRHSNDAAISKLILGGEPSVGGAAVRNQYIIKKEFVKKTDSFFLWSRNVNQAKVRSTQIYNICSKSNLFLIQKH